MTLEERVNEEIKQAMLQKKDKVILEAYRAIKAVIIIAKTEKGHLDQLTPETETRLLQKMVKQRIESAEIYKSQNRMDLYEKEWKEKEIIEQYLPKPMSEGEIMDQLKKIISEVGASSPSDIGRVMGVASKALAGKADNKLIAEKVRQLLTK